MVDWDRVEQLHQKGQSWEEIAADPKVGFHPDQSVSQAGPALRRLYYRRKSRAERQTQPVAQPKRSDTRGDRRWSLARIGYLVVPLLAIWFIVAYLVPSPVGLIISAIPYIAIVLAIGVFILAFGLLRTTQRWSKVFRSTVILGVVLGLVLTGLITLTAVLSGCPFLPSSSSLAHEPAGWTVTPSYVNAWQENGLPLVYYYGATWCPYCSASSWAVWKALTEFQTNFNGQTNGIPGTSLAYYSSPNDVYPSTPEIELSSAQFASAAASFSISYDTSGVDGHFPGTSNCIQQAYVSAYSGNAIPFAAVAGRYIHGASALADPCLLQSYAGTGNQAVATSVLQESGTPWSGGTCSGSSVAGINEQAGWVTAYMVRSAGYTTVAAFLSAYPALNNPGKYQWTTTMTNIVNSDLAQIS